MQLNDKKEAFSHAYTRAIASVAGFNCMSQEFDRDSIDISFKSDISPYVVIGAQLKATSRSDVVVNNEIHYSLPIKNYNDLRGETIMPRILIVLILPDKHECDQEEQSERWINQTLEQLSLKKCAYWMNLYGMPDSTNQANITIKIPMDEAHMFKPSVLNILTEQVLALRTGEDNG